MATKPTDAEIRRAVLRELERDPRVEPTEVGVEVDEGLVAGVDSVADQLPIDPDPSHSVARGSGHAADRLLWEGHSGGLDACVDCGAPLRCQEVPDLGDDHAWTSLAQEHRPGCRWIGTRGRRRPAPAALGRRTA